MIDSFRGKYDFLSNFYPCWITHEEINYPSVEHFYVAMKTHDPDIRLHASQILLPSDVKRFGRTFKTREDWPTMKLVAMHYGLTQKFSREPLRSKLLETGDVELVEGNTWGGRYWGVDKRTGEGENMLGKMLMEIRDKVKNI